MLRKSLDYAEKGVKDSLEHNSLHAVVFPISAIHATSIAATLAWPIITVPIITPKMQTQCTVNFKIFLSRDEGFRKQSFANLRRSLRC